ncbi:MAG: 16S rRNA (uracil(1498)-N(3))-methyltransferase [Clostridia bacterium]|nr:16S rRNA (uracil(1498)-N(3))-methyltransferase [Clostridia bacterium]
MYHFFVSPEQISKTEAVITGSDVNHIVNVLRMKIGEKIVVSDKNGASYCCEISEMSKSAVTARILDGQVSDSELPVKITLFQGLPKSDKMELIIQKAVELGAYRIVPVEMARCVVKLDGKKKAAKAARWQTIAESAAKQSGRGIIPEVGAVMSLSDALEEARKLDMFFVPYECADSVKKFKEKLDCIQPGMSVGIFIGPEGGYEESEIEKAKVAGGEIVSLGKRILRTETAGIAALSVCMFAVETNIE